MLSVAVGDPFRRPPPLPLLPVLSLPCAGAWQTNVIVTPHDVDNNNVDDVGQGERQRYIEWEEER